MAVSEIMPDLKNITEILNNNPDFTKQYFLEHASGKMIEEWVMQRSHLLNFPEVKTVQSGSTSEFALKPLYPSTLQKVLKGTEEQGVIEQKGIKKKKTFQELLQLSEKDLLMELIRDIAHELDA